MNAEFGISRCDAGLCLHSAFRIPHSELKKKGLNNET